MRDFDVKRRERFDADREFRIGGETFSYKASIRPEVLASYQDRMVEVGDDEKAMLPVIDAFIVGMIEGDDASGRWALIRANDFDAISIGDLEEVANWLIEAVSGRTPTQPLSDSSPGPERTGTTSTVVSSSPDTPVAPPTLASVN